MIGGFHQSEVNADTQAVWDSVQGSLEHHANWVQGQTWTIDSVSSQVVAGTNYWFHVTSNHGVKKSVRVFVPLPHTGAPAEVGTVVDGHTEATCN